MSAGDQVANEPGFHTLTDLCGAAERRARGGQPSAVGAFNVWFYAQTVGVLKGLQRADAPAVLQSTKGALHFFGGADRVVGMVRRAMADSGHRLPVCLQLDHGNEESALACLDAGFSSVMIDASDQEFDGNAATTAGIVERAHPRGATVEGEYGKLKGVEDDIAHEKTTYADPARVPEFFRASSCDALAIAYGTSHGPNKGAHVDALRTEIVDASYRGLVDAGLAGDHFLVGHGSSTVPGALVDEINEFGGAIGATQGIPMEKIREGIRSGLRKINIDTDLLLGVTATTRRYLSEHRDRVDAYPDTLGRVAEGFAGVREMTVWGNVRDPGTIIDPRGYFGVMNPEIIEFPPTEAGGLGELMAVIEERVAGHVEMLATEFGSAGLAGDI